VRRPRVHIKFDVELEDGVPMNELPFVVGVMGDYSGDATKDLPKLKDRKFIEIDRDNFDEVLRRQNVGLNLRVNNTLADDGSEMPVQLKFEAMDDFSPAAVAEQVPALKKLLETRSKLNELLTKVDLSDDLEKLLGQILQNSEDQKSLASDLGLEASGTADGGDESGSDDTKGDE
jgi:type VI secretion system protein ImpB